ncbi:DUF6612 family protein [Paenibacillus sp. strain BS8-2]
MKKRRLLALTAFVFLVTLTTCETGTGHITEEEEEQRDRISSTLGDVAAINGDRNRSASVPIEADQGVDVLQSNTLEADHRRVEELLERAVDIRGSSIELTIRETIDFIDKVSIQASRRIDIIWDEQPTYYSSTLTHSAQPPVKHESYGTPEHTYFTMGGTQWFKNDHPGTGPGNMPAPLYLAVDYQLLTSSPYAQLQMLLQYTNKLKIEETPDEYRIRLLMDEQQLNAMFMGEDIFLVPSILTGEATFDFAYDKSTIAPISFAVALDYKMKEESRVQSITGTFAAHNERDMIEIPESILNSPYLMD